SENKSNVSFSRGKLYTPYYWPSNNAEPENTDYAVYLCKRTMQNKTRLELADYEAENLAKLQKLLSKKWELIYMQAEAQIKVDKKRDKMERKILDSQERAFWDVYRPTPGCVNTTEEDIRKTMRMRRTDHPNLGFFRSKPKANKIAQSPLLPHSPLASCQPTTSSQINSTCNQKLCEQDEVTTLENLKKEKDFLKRRLERRYVKVSRVSENYTNYFDQYTEFDPFITPADPSNPWISESTEFWDMEKSPKDIPQRRVRRWGFSIYELLKDPCGREMFRRFLEREFSSENLRFYEVCTELRYATNKDIVAKVEDIYNEFLAPVASCPINIDSRVMAITKTKMENPDRYTYDEAREHIFNLMTRDSYNRFLRSDTYRDCLASAKKKQKTISTGRMSIVRPILNNN
ncbi:regulator of G- signaling 7 isoform X1, partial [Brachionus plicatilis]